MPPRKKKSRKEELLEHTVEAERLARKLETKNDGVDQLGKEAEDLEQDIVELQISVQNIEMLQEDAERKQQGLQQSLRVKQDEGHCKENEFKEHVPVSLFVNDPETQASRGLARIRRRNDKRMQSIVQLEAQRRTVELEGLVQKFVYQRSSDKPPESTDLGQKFYYEEICVNWNGGEEEDQKLFRLRRSDEFLFGDLLHDAAAFWNLNVNNVYLSDKAGVVYAPGMALHEEIRFMEKEDPEFDPEEFQVILDFKPAADEEEVTAGSNA